MDNKLYIKITNNNTLLEGCDYLHDASFDLDIFEYDKQNGKCNFRFEREYLEDESSITYTSKLLLFTKLSFPLIASELVLENIRELNIRDRAKIGIYTFNECVVEKSEYIFNFCEDMEIHIQFYNGPTGYLKDKEILDKKRSYWTFRNLFSKNKNR